MSGDWIEVHNPMDQSILVEVDGTEVAVKPDQTLRVKDRDTNSNSNSHE